MKAFFLNSANDNAKKAPPAASAATASITKDGKQALVDTSLDWLDYDEMAPPSAPKTKYNKVRPRPVNTKFDSVRVRNELMSNQGVSPFILERHCKQCEDNIVLGCSTSYFLAASSGAPPVCSPRF
ncbi:hypothetical protein BGW39_000802 [Mortierella sp. 14UC]|nr:hypothetical protein BGW39_000802 [Mortierella sp. 14UC]